MKQTLVFLTAMLLSITAIYAQTSQRTVSGTIRNCSTGEPLAGVPVAILGTSEGAVTNSEGRFTITISVRIRTLSLSVIGFDIFKLDISPDQDKYDFCLGRSNRNVVVRGTVTDAYGTPLEGVRIRSENERRNFTDSSGRYSYTGIAGDPLSFQYDGCETKVLRILNDSILNVSLFCEIPFLQDWNPPALHIENYESQGDVHKLYVYDGSEQQAIVEELGIPNRAIQIEKYYDRTLYVIKSDVYNRLSEKLKEKLTAKDDMNRIKLRNEIFDPTERNERIANIPRNLQANLRANIQYRIVQFVGPPRDIWINELKEYAEIVHYVHENAYLVRTSADLIEKLEYFNTQNPYVQAVEIYHPYDILHPSLNLDYEKDAFVTIQFFDTEEGRNGIKRVQELSTKVVRESFTIPPYINTIVALPAKALREVAYFTDVVNIEPIFPATLHGEAQALIVADILGRNLTTPASAYLDWLAQMGLDQYNDSLIIEIGDTGFDNGKSNLNLVHDAFKSADGTSSRVTDIQAVWSTNPNDLLDIKGHGTLVASAAAGYNNAVQKKDEDELERNLRHGLGIAPYSNIKATNVTIGVGQFYYILSLTSLRNSSSLVKVSNNSWGVPTEGRYCSYQDYDWAAQEYDYLCRTKETTIVFSAGNSGKSGDCTLATFGGQVSKNTITVGASENFHKISPLTPSVNAKCRNCCDIGSVDMPDEIADFSSRGPTHDGRNKPDIVAPGTKIIGNVSSNIDALNYQYCDVDNKIYNPTLGLSKPYIAASGTSFSAPAVSGAAALIHQWFKNKLWNLPSPAMVKAFMLNAATYMNDEGGNLPSNSQGMGRLNLGTAFDNVSRVLTDQDFIFDNAGADTAYVFNGKIANDDKPLRITLAYTDAHMLPSVGIKNLCNNLDLKLTVKKANSDTTLTYRGNYFINDFSYPIDPAMDEGDDLNNVESIYISAADIDPADTFTIEVIPNGGINCDGIPRIEELRENEEPNTISNDFERTDQDFALVVYNAESNIGEDTGWWESIKDWLQGVWTRKSGS